MKDDIPKRNSAKYLLRNLLPFCIYRNDTEILEDRYNEDILLTEEATHSPDVFTKNILFSNYWKKVSTKRMADNSEFFQKDQYVCCMKESHYKCDARLEVVTPQSGKETKIQFGRHNHWRANTVPSESDRFNLTQALQCLEEASETLDIDISVSKGKSTIILIPKAVRQYIAESHQAFVYSLPDYLLENYSITTYTIDSPAMVPIYIIHPSGQYDSIFEKLRKCIDLKPTVIFTDLKNQAMNSALCSSFLYVPRRGDFLTMMQRNATWLFENNLARFIPEMASTLRILWMSNSQDIYRKNAADFKAYWLRQCPKYAEYFANQWASIEVCWANYILPMPKDTYFERWYTLMVHRHATKSSVEEFILLTAVRQPFRPNDSSEPSFYSNTAFSTIAEYCAYFDYRPQEKVCRCGRKSNSQCALSMCKSCCSENGRYCKVHGKGIFGYRALVVDEAMQHNLTLRFDYSGRNKLRNNIKVKPLWWNEEGEFVGIVDNEVRHFEMNRISEFRVE